MRKNESSSKSQRKIKLFFKTWNYLKERWQTLLREPAKNLQTIAISIVKYCTLTLKKILQPIKYDEIYINMLLAQNTGL